jgi:two-component system, NtrC family, response regulator HydG
MFWRDVVTMKSEIKELSKEIISFLNAFPEPRLVIDTNYNIVGANNAYIKHFNANKSLVGRKCHEVSHHYMTPCDQHGEACPLATARQTKEISKEVHVHFTPRGKEHVGIELIPILDDDGEPFYYIETLRSHDYTSATPSMNGMVGSSKEFMKMISMLDRVAQNDTSVLLLGESGTGKEEIAKTLHNQGSRAKQPFVVVECTGLTDSLFESELFGYEKGAFTGAVTNKKGLVESADGGTLFLDEIGEVPLHQQVKLLRLIESKTYRRVGSTEIKHCDFRLICATHRDLSKMVSQGKFREDLFYRISSFPIHLPPLRDREEDIVSLAESLIKRIAPYDDYELTQSAIEYLESYEFYGNIRELRNILERAILLTDGNKIQKTHLVPIEINHDNANKQPSCTSCRSIQPLESMESKYIQCLMREHGENIDLLSEKLKVSKRTLYRIIKKIRESNDQSTSMSNLSKPIILHKNEVKNDME